MRILLVNDDGYGSEGLMALYEALSPKHEVMIVAPDGQRSGAGHSVTLHNEFVAKKMELGYAVSGTPADCVKVGLRFFMKDCDMVVSGINPGANLGVDCNYSGTAAAAREAAIQGVPALASSCYCRVFKDVKYLAQVTARAVEELAAHPLPKGAFLNLNMPNFVEGQEMPVRWTKMGHFIYDVEFEMQELDGGDVQFTPKYGHHVMRDEGDTDARLVRQGVATLSAVGVNGEERPPLQSASTADSFPAGGEA